MSKTIPQEFINLLLEKVSLVDVISGVTELKPKGDGYHALCPFHKENTPSFVVTPKKGFYYCFGCKAHGNAISFVMDYHKYSFVQAINNQGGQAVGLSGKDANLMICDQTNPDLGLVGTPQVVNPDVLKTLFDNDLIPVIAPLGAGQKGETYNVNGDTAAGAIAAALKADRLLLLTDVDGVKNLEGDILTELTSDQIISLIKDGVIAGGMIPKTETALKAIENGVRAVVILDGRAPNACLLELFTEHGVGSLIRKK